MIYTKMIKTAMKIAFDAHKEQVDKVGLPYIYHPIHLAEQMDDEVSICVALLHDVVEDTNISFEDLIEQGISNEVIITLRLLSHDNEVQYMDYIQNIKNSGDVVAISIKLADLKHNSDISRLDIVDERDVVRCEKYLNAIKVLIQGELYGTNG